MKKLLQFGRFGWLAPWLLVCTMWLGLGPALAAGSDANSATSLQAKYAELGPQLSNNQFKRPLHVVSAESPTHLKADIYALVDYPFAAVQEALIDPEHWCDVLILHLNTKYCRASGSRASRVLMVSIGKKTFQPLNDAYSVEFAFSVAATTPEYFDVGLNAKTGPLGTSDYHIELEATPVQSGKTFLHLTYSYAYSFVGRVAMQGYLATIGSGKVGFTSTGQQAGGQPDYIGGVRGVVERNTMRYYLAIDAYLSALSIPPPEQLDKRLQNWFSSTELYPRQLREVDRAAYLAMKRSEYLRMQQSP
jgi:hypothetical protein